MFWSARFCTEVAHLTRFELVTFAFGGQWSTYAASRGMARSTNRKNRVLRASATTDSCDISAGEPEGSFKDRRLGF
jgi:hypothetical protein